MLYWAFLCLVIAIIAAVFGFGLVATTGAMIGKFLFVLFMIGFVVSLILSARGRPDAH